MSKPTFTPRQAAAWTEVIADLASREIDAPDSLRWPWIIQWAEEVRPGRGHDFQAVCVVDDRLAHVGIDVYGGWWVATADVTWIHGSDDDECSCERCEAERQVEDL